MTNPSPTSFAAEVKQAREAAGLSQEQWAQKIGVSTRTIARWESGESEPRSAVQRAAVAQAVREAGSTPSVRSLTSVLIPALGPIVGLASPALGMAVSAGASAVASVTAVKKASSARRRLEVLEVLETSADTLKVTTEDLARETLALIDFAVKNSISLEELREITELAKS